MRTGQESSSWRISLSLASELLIAPAVARGGLFAAAILLEQQCVTDHDRQRVVEPMRDTRPASSDPSALVFSLIKPVALAGDLVRCLLLLRQIVNMRRRESPASDPVRHDTFSGPDSVPHRPLTWRCIEMTGTAQSVIVSVEELGKSLTESSAVFSFAQMQTNGGFAHQLARPFREGGENREAGAMPPPATSWLKVA